MITAKQEFTLEQFQDLHQRVKLIDPNQLTTQSFLELVSVMDGKFKSKDSESEEISRQIFQCSDKILIEFSKAQNSWSVVYQVLQTPNLDDSQYFQASNIFKNKLKIDFVQMKTQNKANAGFEIRDNLMTVIKQMAAQNKPKFIMENLCLGFTYVIMHIHQQWPNLITDLIQSLNSNPQEMLCLLKIVEYMASECEDDYIVIEESIREQFFDFLDTISSIVFDQILNNFASQINQLQDNKQKMKVQLSKAFYKWIKLMLPISLLDNLPVNNVTLLNFIFEEMITEGNSEDNQESATDCIIQLVIITGKRRQNLLQLNNYILEKIQILSQRVPKIVEEQDEELGNLYQEIFIEIGKTNLKDIIESESQNQLILDILLELMTIGYGPNNQGEKIKSRYQTTFWKNFIQYFDSFGSQAYKLQKMKQFEAIILKLIDKVIVCLSVDCEDTFQEFNFQNSNEDIFDDYFLNKRDLGKLIKETAKLIGFNQVIPILVGKMEAGILKAQQDQAKVQNWIDLHAVLTAIEQATRIIEQDDLGKIQQVIMCILQLPSDQYLAFRYIATDIIQNVSFALKDKTKQGTYLIDETKQFVQYVIPGLSNNLTKVQSSSCFVKICNNTKAFMYQFTDEIIQSILPQSAKDWKCETCNENVLTSLAYLICRVGDHDQQKCTEYLRQVITKLIQPLNENIIWMQTEQSKTALTEKSINAYIYQSSCEYIDLIAGFCESCRDLVREDQVSPFEPIFNEIWPFIQLVLQQFPHMETMCESTSRLLKHSMRIVPQTFENHLMTFLQIVIDKFNQNPYSSFIYSVEICLKQYGDQKFEQMFQEAFDMIALRCCRLLTTKDDLVNYPNIVEDFFSLVRRAIELRQYIFINSQQISQICGLVVMCIGLDHPESAKSHSNLLRDLLDLIHDQMQSQIHQQNPETNQNRTLTQNELNLINFFIEQGNAIVLGYFNVIVNIPSRNVIDYHIDSLTAICNAFKQPADGVQGSLEWTKNALSTLPQTIYTHDESQRLVSQFNSSKRIKGLDTELHVIYKRAKNYNRR